MWIARRLRIPESTPRTVQLAILFYLGHLLCQGWIGSSQGFLGLSCVAAILALIRGELQVRYHPIYVPLALFTIASTISALLSARPLGSLLQVSEWFLFLTIPLALTMYRAVPLAMRLTLTCLFLLGIFQGLQGLTQFYLLGHRQLESRITGTAAHVMTYSGLILPLSLLSLLIAIRRRDRLAALCAVLSSWALVLTFTRSAWLGWAAGLVTLLVMRRSRWLAYALPLLILVITVTPLALFGRLISSFDVRQSSNLDRIRMVQGGIEIIKDYPLFGVGPSNIKEIYPLYREPDAPRFRIPHLHNNVIQIWAERGLLALMGYLLLIGTFMALCIRELFAPGERGLLAEIGLSTSVALFVAGLFEFNFGDSEVLLLMLDVMALVCAGLERIPAGPSNDPATPAVLP